MVNEETLLQDFEELIQDEFGSEVPSKIESLLWRFFFAGSHAQDIHIDVDLEFENQINMLKEWRKVCETYKIRSRSLGTNLFDANLLFAADHSLVKEGLDFALNQLPPSLTFHIAESGIRSLFARGDFSIEDLKAYHCRTLPTQVVWATNNLTLQAFATFLDMNYYYLYRGLERHVFAEFKTDTLSFGSFVHKINSGDAWVAMRDIADRFGIDLRVVF